MTNFEGFCPTRLERITRWMECHVAAGRLPGLAVQITRRGRVVYSQQRGLRDVEAGLPVEADTVWRIYSMTKPITTMAALMLYEEGAFQLEQPVADFIPGLGQAGVWAGGAAALSDVKPLQQKVTFHDLMTHQSGLVYGKSAGNLLEQAYMTEGLDMDRPGDTMAALVDRLCQLPLLFQPGEHWFYGLSTDVLGRLIEVISGQSLGTFLADRILAPLGMRDTGFALQPGQASRMAASYGPSEGGLKRLAPPDDPNYVPPVTLESGGGGLLSTMADYQRFTNMLLAEGRYEGGRLLGRKTFAAMVSNQIGEDMRSRELEAEAYDRIGGIGFGLGFAVMMDPARNKILSSPGEYSWGGYASTTFWVDPAEEMTVILMTQLLPYTTYNLWREIRVLSYQALID